MSWNSGNTGGVGGGGGGRSFGGGRHGGRNFNPGGGGGFRGGGQGGRSGPGGRRYQPNPVENGGTAAEQPLFNLCMFYARAGQCGRGDGCKFQHSVVSMFAHQAHQQPIKALEVMNVGEIPKILTGSSDGTVSVWNLGAQVPSAEGTVKTTGKVTHLEVKDSTILWAVDEPVSPETMPHVTVGTVYLLNSSDMSTIPVKRSEEFPFTSSFGNIRNFIITAVENVTYLITAGGEGLIRTWKFDPTTSKFEALTVLEGHFGGVTSLLLNETLLWSGSMDSTIRVWDLGTGRCVGVLSQHAEAVSCLCFIPASPANVEAYIASGSADTEVKIWKTNGELVGGVAHRSPITALSVFQDAYSGVQSLLIGLGDGCVQVRACSNMALIFQLEASIYKTGTVWGIKYLGKSCFAVGGEDGQLIVWKVDCPLVDKK